MLLPITIGRSWLQRVQRVQPNPGHVLIHLDYRPKRKGRTRIAWWKVDPMWVPWGPRWIPRIARRSQRFNVPRVLLCPARLPTLSSPRHSAESIPVCIGGLVGGPSSLPTISYGPLRTCPHRADTVLHAFLLPKLEPEPESRYNTWR